MSTTLDSQEVVETSPVETSPVETLPVGSRTSAKGRSPRTVTRRWGRSAATWRSRTGIFLALGAISLSAIAAILGGLGGGSSETGLIYHTVSRSDLPIVVTERGNLESQQDVQVICEVDDIPGDGISGTLIVWIIPNGSSVRKGDLLVEFDSSQHQERLDRQILLTERAKSERLQAQAKYDNQITQNETSEAEAELQVKLSELELLMFTDQEAGTHQLEVEEIKRLIDDTNSEILAAQANLELRNNDKLGIESLFKLGYAGKNELDRSRLDFLQAEGQFAAKMNRLQTQMASLVKKETFEREMQILRLQGNLDTARRNRIQVLRNNEALLAQAHAQLDSAVESLKKEEELLARYREYVENCKVYAPEDGMVAYVSDRRREEIREGAAIRPRQAIMTIPNLRAMQVKTAVHESVLDQVYAGQRATIRVDAFPDRQYAGTVQQVAVLPDQGGWMSSDTKVYPTIVTIDEEVEHLKPGMTAVVEIHVDYLKGVTTVPIQAVLQRGQANWCFIGQGRDVQLREIALGRTNDRFVEIVSGIAEGERVVLNPMSMADALPSQEEEPALDVELDDLADPEAEEFVATSAAS